MAAYLALVAGVLQAVGYFFYIQKAVRRENAPNPLSWLMFAYGTTLLLFLEWDRGATWSVLVLPAVCATSSLVVVYFCWSHGGFKSPVDMTNALAFTIDILLTICYMAAWALMSHGVISEQGRTLASLVLLLCWNVGVFTSFTPLIRSVKSNPTSEYRLPWILWGLAYTTLGVATLTENGFGHLDLLLYPTVNAFVHVAVGVMARGHKNA